jgi:Protein of unknown function (DUF1501)
MVIQPFVGLIADGWWKMHDFNATVLHLLGMNHERLTFKFRGLAQKLNRVVPAKIIPGLIA